MVVVTLPNWYKKAEEKIGSLIKDIAHEQNINLQWVHDSIGIQDATQSILNTLWMVQENANPNQGKEQLAEMEAFTNEERCKAITKSLLKGGERCKNKAKKEGYCMTHYKALKKKGMTKYKKVGGRSY